MKQHAVFFTALFMASAMWVPNRASAEPDAVFFRSFLKTHCVSCHNPEKKKGKLVLEGLAELPGDRAKYGKILEQLRAGDMPPEEELQPDLEDFHRVTAWIQKGLGDQPAVEAVEVAVRPHEGNHLPHSLLFGVEPGPSIPPPPRTWRLSPAGYSSGLLRSLKMDGRHIPRISKPFALRTDAGIKDYSALYWVDEGTTDVLIRNAEKIVNIMTSHKLHKPKNGGPVRVSMARYGGKPLAPEEFAPLLHPDVKPKREELETAVLLLFRRALVREPSAAELESLLALYEKSAVPPGDHISAGKTMLMAPLLSPEALHRFELGSGDEIRPGVRMLSPKELAFALSLAFSGDREPGLFEAAVNGGLKTKKDVENHVRRILNDPEIYKPRLLGFFHEYFGYDRAPDVCKDEQRDYVHHAHQLVFDTNMLVLSILEKDQDVLKELLVTPKSFVDGASMKTDGKHRRPGGDTSLTKILATSIAAKIEYFATDKPAQQVRPKHKSRDGVRAAYGLKEWPANQPVDLPGDRIGILMQPSWLVAWSSNFFNDPVRRGLWIREHLLGQAVPPVPVGVVIVLPDDPKRTLRDRMEITKAEACWTCHKKIDGLGFPFEAFDHFGRPRTNEISSDWEAAAVNKANGQRKYEKGEKRPEKLQENYELPLVTSGYIRGSGIPGVDGPVKNVQEMIRKLADSERVRQVFVRYVFRYYMGRNETTGDAATLQAADRAYVESGGSFKELLVSLLSSESFTCRTVPKNKVAKND